MKLRRTIALAAAAAVIMSGAAAVSADTYSTNNGVLTRYSDDGTSQGPVSGWVTKGKDKYYYKDGKMIKSKWLLENGKPTYYIRKDGRMAQGKLRLNGQLYIFGKNGKLEEEEPVYADMTNPFVECSSFESAYKTAGFYMSVPESVKGADHYSISAIRDYLIQVTYYDKAGNKILTIRKGSTRDDVSGDYNKYKYKSANDIDGKNVKVKGSSENSLSVASWVYKGYSFAVTPESPMTYDDLTRIVEKVY